MVDKIYDINHQHHFINNHQFSLFSTFQQHLKLRLMFQFGQYFPCGISSSGIPVSRVALPYIHK